MLESRLFRVLGYWLRCASASRIGWLGTTKLPVNGVSRSRITNTAEAIATAPSRIIVYESALRGALRPKAAEHDDEPKHQHEVERKRDRTVRLLDQFPALIQKALELIEAVAEQPLMHRVSRYQLAETEFDISEHATER